MVKFEEVIKEIYDKLKKMKIKFLFSGAIAANVYRTIPRATMDVDVAIPFNEQVLEQIKDKFRVYQIEDWELLKARLDVKKTHPELIIPEYLRLKHPTGYELDFFPLYSNYFSHKVKAKILNFEIDVLSPEDLILIKSIFYRYKDRDDIENILKNPNLKLDLDYLIRELHEFENEELIELIKRLRKPDLK